MLGIHPILEFLQQTRCASDVLATIIQVEGSAYLKEGTTMLLGLDGAQIGLISAGCLESDLWERANEVFSTGLSRAYSYNMGSEHDLSWGKGAGCNGVIHVLLEPINARLHQHLMVLKQHLESGYSVLLAKKINLEDTFVTEYQFVSENGQHFGHQQSDFPDLSYCFPWGQKNGMMAKDLFIQCFTPKPRVIVFGAGPDAQPLCEFAAKSGFSVIVSDPRETLCNKEHFPDAQGFWIGYPDQLMGQLVTPSDSVVIMTHHFQWDQEILDSLLEKDLYYVGILGPRRRTARLLGGKRLPKWLHSPIGLPIGAVGPEEIAISIVAELIYSLRGTGT